MRGVELPASLFSMTLLLPTKFLLSHDSAKISSFANSYAQQRIKPSTLANSHNAIPKLKITILKMIFSKLSGVQCPRAPLEGSIMLRHLRRDLEYFLPLCREVRAGEVLDLQVTLFQRP